MEVSAVISTYCVVPDASPFVLYGLSISTFFSVQTIIKRYSDFYKFHKTISYFVYESVGPDQILLDFLPALPDSLAISPLDSRSILVRSKQDRKDRLNQYLARVVSILASPQFNKFQPWGKLIYDFLCLEVIRKKEEEYARMIQLEYRSYKWRSQYRRSLQ